MKTLEKMILCCIWICIALAMVLIKDQVDLNHKIEEKMMSTPVPDLVNEQKKMLYDERATVHFISENISILNDAEVQFYEDGTVELSVDVTDSVIDEVKNRVDHELIEFFLPALKGTEVRCKAKLSSESIDVTGCNAGIIDVPESLLEIMNEKVNEMWTNLVASRRIDEIEVNENGISVTLQPE
jgi:hypothetical protein